MISVISWHTTEFYKTTNAFYKIKSHFIKINTCSLLSTSKYPHFGDIEGGTSEDERTSVHICVQLSTPTTPQPAAAACRISAANAGSAFVPEPLQGAASKCFSSS